jgi:phosphopantetheinyl transferase
LLRVGYTKLRELRPAELALVPGDEQEREFGADSRRNQFLCGRSLLRLMLQEYTGRPAASHGIAVADGGKPVCTDGTPISIAHSGDTVACAIAARGGIGIDLERIDLRRNRLPVAQRFFDAEEARWLEGQPADRFLMLWVLKEAWVKLHGRSIFGGLNGLACNVVPPAIVAAADATQRCDLSLYSGADSFLAVATDAVASNDVVFVRWDPGCDATRDTNDFLLTATTQNVQAKRTA